uniref:uncharacterized protein LOC122606003 n=1 Tax=Erigeron canadensis TaxID=72917 RepID=UPI001CB9AF18|nr:uncharacterized protein LOC122606003 [Erigeron canadensis]
MATQITRTPKNRNTSRALVSISGPAYTVAVGGAPRGSKAKSKRYIISSSQCTTGEKCRILSRYLRPPLGSCHDLCKHGIENELLELKRPTRRSGSRKRPVIKKKIIKMTEVPAERTKITKSKPKPSRGPIFRGTAECVNVMKWENSIPSKKGGVSKSSSTTQHELNIPKRRNLSFNSLARLNGQKLEKDSKTTKTTRMVRKSTSVERVSPKATRTGSLPKNHKFGSPVQNQNRITKNKLKKLIAEKVQEMTLHEAERTELEFVAPTVEIVECPPTLPTESTNLPNSESSQSASDEQDVSLKSQHDDDKAVSEEECEYTGTEEVVYEDDYEIETSEGNCNFRVVICEDKDGGYKVKFRKGRIVEFESGDSGPRRLKFRRGKVLDDNGEEQIGRIRFRKRVDEARNDSCHDSKTVTLKHQEMQRKEAQELFNRVIEETASKLVESRKTRVGALVGAFETVISLQPTSE